MPITFNNEGGFLAGTISSSGNDIFIQTSGSVGSINVGTQLQVSGSQIFEKDLSGNIRNKKTFNSDGSITQEKFDAGGKTTETKVKNPSKGKEFTRSGSATANQIEFEQTTVGAFITVSGSSGNTGYNLIESDKFKLIRSTHTNHISGGTTTTTAVNQVDNGGNWQYNVNTGLLKTRTASTQLTVSASGDLFVKRHISASGNLIVEGSISAQEITSSIITSSIIQTSGSNIFGDESTDTHTFVGDITSSGNISSSGTITGNSLVGTLGTAAQTNITSVGTLGSLTVSGDINANGNIVGDDATDITNIETIECDNIVHDGDTDTKIAFTNDNITFTAGNIEMLKLVESVANAVVINEGGVDVNLRVESANNQNMLFIDASTDRVGIGISTPTSALQVEGVISSSGGISSSNATFTGDISANSASFNYITASHIDTDSDTISVGGEAMNKTLIQNLKRGHSSTNVAPVGRIQKTADVFVTGNVTASGDFLNSQFVQMTNSSSVIDTFNTGSFRSAKYTLQVTSASNYQVSEMLVLHHNSTASNTEYAQINSGLNLLDFTTDINGANVRLNAAGSFISCSVRYERTIIPI